MIENNVCIYQNIVLDYEALLQQEVWVNHSPLTPKDVQNNAFLNLNSNEPLYYPYTVSVSKCGESCNAFHNLYAQGVPDELKKYEYKKVQFNIIGK